MKFTWKGEPLGELVMTRLFDVQEMRWVKQELPEYKHPAKLLHAALDLDERVKVYGDDGKPLLDAAGKPQMRRVPSDDWDPDAFAALVCILHRRAGAKLNIEQVDGTIADLDFEMSPDEIAALKGAADDEGKAQEPGPGDGSTSDATTSTTGSSDTPPGSGSSTD